MPTTSFTQLDAWKKARQVTGIVFELTDHLPRQRQFSLGTQMERAVLSIESNIAEGYGRRAPRDKARFTTISKGSAEELQHFLLICKDIGYVRGEEIWLLLDDVGAMLRRLIQRTLERT